jgi:RND family efflux transporter MFP subunit
MNTDSLDRLKIPRTEKRRSRATLNTILGLVVGISAVALYYARPWSKEGDRVLSGNQPKTKASAREAIVGASPGRDSSTRSPGTASAGPSSAPSAGAPSAGAPSAGAPSAGAPAAGAGPVADSILTVSGYLINRERIELSPRFMGVVKWIGVKKGDLVTNNQVVVLLDDAEYQARRKEAQARLENAKVAVAKAELDLRRAEELVAGKVEMQKVLDDARLQLESARATVREIDGQVALIQTYLDWTVIRSPINGVVLEKLVDPNELVTPQSFGGTRGPSTALISVADPKDLQVEIDLNEADVSKVFLGQRCRVSPEAYLDRAYGGTVAEIAPEASRQKGTLQIKVQIEDPDKYLTPELSARVDFLGSTSPDPRPAR